MLVWNPTEREIRASYDGRRYTLPAGCRIEFPEDCARGLVQEAEHEGLVSLRYGEDEQVVALRSKKARLATINQLLDDTQSYLQDCANKGMVNAAPKLDVKALIAERASILREINDSGTTRLFASPEAQLAEIQAAMAGKPPPTDAESLDDYLDGAKMSDDSMRRLYNDVLAKQVTGQRLTPADVARKRHIERAAKMRGISLRED